MSVTRDQTERTWHEVAEIPVQRGAGPPAAASLAAIVVVALLVAWLLRPWLGAAFFVIFAATLILERKGPAKARRAAGRVRSIQQRFGVLLQRAMLALVWAFGVVPLALLRGHRHGGMSAGWHDRSADKDPAFARQFTRSVQPRGRADRGQRRWLSRLAVCIGAFMLLIGSDVALGSLVQAVRGPGESGRVELAAYKGADWAQEYWDGSEDRQRWRYIPYLGWLQDEISTPYVNVSDGERRTWVADANDANDASGTNDTNDTSAPVVWLFGGSTTFGTGQRDDHTIASELARLAHAEGVTIDASNYGVSGYRLWQENLHLSYRLLSGGEPDLVVFYDGVNEPQRHGEVDSAAPLHSREHIFRARLEEPPTPQGALADEWSKRSAVLQAARFARSKFRSSAPGQSVQNAKGVPADRALDNIMGIYSEAVAIGRDTAARHGFEVVHFWQPNIYTKEPSPAEADAWNVRGYRTWDRDWYQEVYDGARGRLPDGVIDISDALDSTDQPVMIDHTHTNELGARLVAERIFAELRPVFDRLTAEAASS